MAAKFTQQHFEAAAVSIGNAYARAEIHGSNAYLVKRGVRILQDEMILAFRIDNPKFDEARFREAIGKRIMQRKAAMKAEGWVFE